MNNNQINGQKNNKEAYCPNPIFNNGTISIGEFKTIEDAMNFPMQEIWRINRTQDNKFNSYVSQGCRLLIICDWGKSIQDSQKFVVALISKSGKITYWDLNDLPINTRQYENSIDNDVLTAIFSSDEEAINAAIKQAKSQGGVCGIKVERYSGEYDGNGFTSLKTIYEKGKTY